LIHVLNKNNSLLPGNQVMVFAPHLIRLSSIARRLSPY
jgi:hypothetical protein